MPFELIKLLFIYLNCYITSIEIVTIIIMDNKNTLYFFQIIPKDMFSVIPPLTLAAISEEKLSQLSVEQTSMIQDVKNLKIWTDIMPKKKKNILVAGYPMSSSTTHEVSFVYLTFLIISAFIFI